MGVLMGFQVCDERAIDLEVQHEEVRLKANGVGECGGAFAGFYGESCRREVLDVPLHRFAIVDEQES